jgi:prevent-host-death family protein
MKTISARDLRHKTSAVLDHVRRGHDVVVTYRGRPIARLTPLERISAKPLDPIGFGMWRDREDLRDVKHWLRSLRAPRYGASSSTPTS